MKSHIVVWNRTIVRTQSRSFYHFIKLGICHTIHGKKEYLRTLKSFKRIVKKIWIDKATAFGFKRSYDFKQRSETSIPDLSQINGHYLYDLSQWDIQEFTFKDLRFSSSSSYDRTLGFVYRIDLHSTIQIHSVE